MSDDLQNRGPADRSRINVNEAWELRYWSQTLGHTADEIRLAVKAVGPMVENVRRHLKGVR
jgi:HAMP domain-containing protein